MWENQDMEWFNWIGLIYVIAILLPNVVFALLKKVDFHNVFENKLLGVLEQIGRYGSMAFMVFNIPYTYFGFFFEGGFWVYIIVNAVLIIAYWLGWIFLASKHPILKAYVLSIVPSAVFLFSALMLRNLPLLITAAIFSYAHITISLENAYQKTKGNRLFRMMILLFSLSFFGLVFGASFHEYRLHPEIASNYEVGVAMGIAFLSISLAFLIVGSILLLIIIHKKRISDSAKID